MFLEVLRWINEKGYIRVEEISRELGISSGLVESIIRELEVRGYIALIIPTEGAPCDLCPLKSICGMKPSGIARSYRLTSKGKRLLERSVKTST